jgi:hypothetical protein
VGVDTGNPLRQAMTPRGLVEGALPSIVFLVLFDATGTRTAALAALGVSAVLIAVRLLRRQRLVEALSGAAGVGLAVALSVGSGEARDYFLPDVVLGLLFGTALLVSALLGRPAFGYVVAAVVPSFRGWKELPPLRRAAVRMTLVAGGWAAAKALFLLSLYLGDRVEALGVAKLALGYPALLVLVAYYAYETRRSLAADGERAAPLPA